LKVLFDQNAPRPLARFLTKHVVTRSAELGWEALKNGELLKAAEAEGFDLIVTADRNIRYQQKLEDRKIALIVLPSGRWPVVQVQLDEVVSAVDGAMPESYQEIPLRSAKPSEPSF
jgi:predicted nuclease of predicted toxin-antitoxin system